MQFGRAQSGNVATLFALALPVLLVATGAAIDFAGMTGERNRLQSAADAAALAAAREFALPGRTEEQVRQVAGRIAKANLGGGEANVSASALGREGVRVTITKPADAAFLPMIGAGLPAIEVAATARISNLATKLCVLALDPSAAQSLHLKSNATVIGPECLVQSNSRHSQGVHTDTGIRIEAEITCSAGGLFGSGFIKGQSLADCPRHADPLADRPPPPVGAGCDRTHHRVELNNSAGSRHKLKPGTYCGGLFIGANSFVRFAPGIYVIKDGPLVLDSNADVVGKHVGFHFVGKEAVLNFTSNAKVHFDAPRDGAMAGILMSEERHAPLNREHVITSNFATNLTGTIYFPRGRFVVDATNEVARFSAYTVIIANQVLLTASPRLVLNANYGATDVPVPPGVSKGARVTLTQ